MCWEMMLHFFWWCLADGWIVWPVCGEVKEVSLLSGFAYNRSYFQNYTALSAAWALRVTVTLTMPLLTLYSTLEYVQVPLTVNSWCLQKLIPSCQVYRSDKNHKSTICTCLGVTLPYCYCENIFFKVLHRFLTNLLPITSFCFASNFIFALKYFIVL
jgi:hypothetical protein